MANILSKHTQRTGDLSDLPVGPLNGLLPGEFGYATDDYRLFIGNEEYAQDTNGTVNYGMPIDLNSVLPGSFEVYLENDDPQIQTKLSNYTYHDFTLTLSEIPPPNHKIVLYFNTEIMTNQTPKKVSDPVRSETMSAPSTDQLFSYITINPSVFDNILIRYTLNIVTESYKRQGTIRVSIDNVTGTFTIEDDYNSNCDGVALDHTFDGVLESVDDRFILTYTTTDTQSAIFSWTEDNFNSIQSPAASSGYSVIAPSTGPSKLATMDTVTRDALIAENGDMIYNTDTNKFQGYANGAWVDLH
jgi:hypothetical protein